MRDTGRGLKLRFTAKRNVPAAADHGDRLSRRDDYPYDADTRAVEAPSGRGMPERDYALRHTERVSHEAG